VTPPFPYSPNPFKTGHLAKTYTKTYTVAHALERKAQRFKMLPLAVKHLKSVARKGVRLRVPVPALVIPETYADGGTRARRPHPATVLKLP